MTAGGIGRLVVAVTVAATTAATACVADDGLTTMPTSPTTAPATVSSAPGTTPTTHTTSTAVITAPVPSPGTTRPAPPPRPPSPPPTAVVERGLDADALSAVTARWAADHPDVGGLAIGVARTGGGDLWVGAADVPDDGKPITRDDHYGVLSITKVFTAALVLRQVAAGRIDLDGAMPALPGVAPPPDGIRFTPRMLLQHTSGLVPYAQARGYDPAAPITPSEAVSLALESPLMFPPGSRAAYATTNYHWLGLLLEHVTARRYEDLVAGLMAGLGLGRTQVGEPPRPGWVGFASGGITSTVEDLTRWAAALFTPGRVLSEGHLSLVTTVTRQHVTHGLWPIAGLPGALGQLTAGGGLVVLPAERAVVVVHLASGGPDSHTHATDVARAVAQVL